MTREEHTRSLSFVVAAWTAIAITASMGAYAVFQYLHTPGISVPALVIGHLWHVLGLGGVIYLLFLIVFRQVVTQPLKAIRLHLYAVATGRLDDLHLTSNVTEVRSIAHGINLMIHRMQLGDEAAMAQAKRDIAEVHELLNDARERVGEIRQSAKQLEGREPRLSAAIAKRGADLDKVLFTIGRRVEHFPSPGQSQFQ